MAKLPVLESGDMLRHLLAYGCVLVRVKGSHHRISNPANSHLSTLPVHSGKDLSPGLFAKILKDLEIDANIFIEFINNR